MSPDNILETRYHLKGVDPETTIINQLKRPVRLVENGRVMPELLR